MFNLTKLEHTLRLKPHLLSLSLEEAVKGELESLFVDKVIANLGLCISVYDIESIDGGFIFANEGAPTYTVKFRLIIFRPYVGEIVSAKLKESNRTGLRLTLGFFDDIYIPELLMPEPSHFKPDADHKNQGIWTWNFNDEEYFIDGQDEIRFRVQNVKFPEIPKEQIGTKPFAPMEITGSLVSDGGLGPVSWWKLSLSKRKSLKVHPSGLDPHQKKSTGRGPVHPALKVPHQHLKHIKRETIECMRPPLKVLHQGGASLFDILTSLMKNATHTVWIAFFRMRRIQIYIKKELIFKFEPLLQEGQCYIISNFGVAKNGGRLPLLPNRWKISFYKGTEVTRIEQIDDNFIGFVNEPFTRLLDTNNEYYEHDRVEDDMLKVQIKVVDILCDLELIYPPALFDIIIHLFIHLPLEALEGEPIRPRWMYPFERYMKKLKGYVRNKSKLEGSIAKGYVAEEALTFSSYYFRDVTTKFNRPGCNVDPPLPTFQFQVFRSIRQRHVDNDKDPEVSTTSKLFTLVCGPTRTPILINSCVVDGVRYAVHSRDECRITQSSGICSPGPDGEMYYGQL
nr:DNA-directed RNA polymerase III subunit RPC8 [Tanacetum cinerariifolium]